MDPSDILRALGDREVVITISPDGTVVIHAVRAVDGLILPVIVVGSVVAPANTLALKLAGGPVAINTITAARDEFLQDLDIKGVSKSHRKHEKAHIDYAAAAGVWRTFDDFSPTAVRAYLMQQRTAGKKAKTIKLRRDTLDRFGKWLVARGLIEKNPVDGIPAPMVEQRQARVIPTDDELRAIIVAASRDWRSKDWGLAVLTMATTGLRVSECKGLTWAMVHLEPGTGHLDLPASLTKSRRPQRAYLSVELAELLHKHARLVGKLDHVGGANGMIRASGVPLDSDHFVEANKMVFVSGLKREQMIVYCRKAGVRRVRDEQTLSYHSLRHYASNRMRALGFDQYERQAAMRHANVSTTNGIYTDFSPTEVSVAQRFANMPSIFLHEIGSVDRLGLDKRDDLVDTCSVAPANTLHAEIPSPRRGANAGATHLPRSGAGTDAHSQGLAQLGSAPRLGRGGPGFESPSPDSTLPTRTGTVVQILPLTYPGQTSRFPTTEVVHGSADQNVPGVPAHAPGGPVLQAARPVQSLLRAGASEVESGPSGSRDPQCPDIRAAASGQGACDSPKVREAASGSGQGPEDASVARIARQHHQAGGVYEVRGDGASASSSPQGLRAGECSGCPVVVRSGPSGGPRQETPQSLLSPSVTQWSSVVSSWALSSAVERPGDVCATQNEPVAASAFGSSLVPGTVPGSNPGGPISTSPTPESGAAVGYTQEIDGVLRTQVGVGARGDDAGEGKGSVRPSDAGVSAPEGIRPAPRDREQACGSAGSETGADAASGRPDRHRVRLGGPGSRAEAGAGSAQGQLTPLSEPGHFPPVHGVADAALRGSVGADFESASHAGHVRDRHLNDGAATGLVSVAADTPAIRECYSHEGRAGQMGGACDRAPDAAFLPIAPALNAAPSFYIPEPAHAPHAMGSPASADVRWSFILPPTRPSSAHGPTVAGVGVDARWGVENLGPDSGSRGGNGSGSVIADERFPQGQVWGPSCGPQANRGPQVRPECLPAGGQVKGNDDAPSAYREVVWNVGGDGSDGRSVRGTEPKASLCTDGIAGGLERQDSPARGSLPQGRLGGRRGSEQAEGQGPLAASPLADAEHLAACSYATRVRLFRALLAGVIVALTTGAVAAACWNTADINKPAEIAAGGANFP